MTKKLYSCSECIFVADLTWAIVRVIVPAVTVPRTTRPTRTTLVMTMNSKMLPRNTGK